MTELADALTSRLRALWGPAVEVTAVRPMPGGASRESWDVRVRTAGDGLAAAPNAASSCSATRAAGPGSRPGTWPSRRRR